MKKPKRSELERWIDGELEMYVKDLIDEGDYAHLRKNLIDIAEAHARNSRAGITPAPAPSQKQ